ncbi:MAG: addiction module protein [Pirellulales bacterium]
MSLRDQIVEQALALEAEDRAFIADKLEESLAPEGFATPEIAAAWAAEIERRVAAYDRGDLEALPGDTAIDRIRERLEQYRAGKVSS